MKVAVISYKNTMSFIYTLGQDQLLGIKGVRGSIEYGQFEDVDTWSKSSAEVDLTVVPYEGMTYLYIPFPDNLEVGQVLAFVQRINPRFAAVTPLFYSDGDEGDGSFSYHHLEEEA